MDHEEDGARESEAPEEARIRNARVSSLYPVAGDMTTFLILEDDGARRRMQTVDRRIRDGDLLGSRHISILLLRSPDSLQSGECSRLLWIYIISGTPAHTLPDSAVAAAWQAGAPPCRLPASALGSAYLLTGLAGRRN